MKNAKNCHNLASVRKPQARGPIVLPDRSIIQGQKLVERPKLKEVK